MSQRGQGFVLIDAVAGLVLLGILAGVLVSASVNYGRVSQRVGARSDALNEAESALQQFQAGAIAATAPGAALSVQGLEAGDAPSGYRWVQVSARNSGGPDVPLVGLVPVRTGTEGGAR